MGEKIIVGPINRGLRTDRTPFVIDNDSFPTLINAYQWRGRVKRKRGTSLLGRLQRIIGTTDNTGAITVTISPTPILSGLVSFNIGTDIFTDPGGTSPVTLITNGSGTATLNRTSGLLTVTGSIASSGVIYFPTLPVMGLEDLQLQSSQYPGNIAFDTDYAYNIASTSPVTITDVSFYKNPLASATLPGYVPKSNLTPLYWNGKDYQQFWSTNYENAFWATNGIDVPYTGSTIGMQFKTISTITATTSTTATISITSHGLVVGDFIFVNEVSNTMTGINFQTGYVTTVNIDGNTFIATFPFASLAGSASSGIVQYLTNTAVPGKDCLRWYDGSPSGGTGTGWVNFMPPLSQGIYSISDLPQRQYYLVGAKIIIPFRDRLLFFGVVVQASSGNPIYLQDTVIWSQNGTPYYNCSYTNTPTATVDTPVNATNVFNAILTPINQVATSPAFFEDQFGFGGFIAAGLQQPITGVGPNEDALIIEFTTIQTRFLYTGNDLDPFNFYLINAELGCSSTFSVIIMDEGILSRGSRGFIITSQTQSIRFDLDILPQFSEISLTNNGAERVTAQRDFINEWVYFTYPSNENTYTYPTQTLQYNYRDRSWGIFNESYTTYGQYRANTGDTWLTIGYNSWNAWTVPWTSGTSTLLEPKIIAGNQQGFILIRDQGTNEATSLYIQNIVGSVMTCTNHCLNNGDYIVISGVQGTIGSSVNGMVFSVSSPSVNSFNLNPSIPSGTYLGGGFITRMYNPLIQTKQFPVSWQMSNKTRLGPQQYLFSTTDNAQIQVSIFLSQDSENSWSNPNNNTPPNGLIYSQVLYTCPESTNLGLTPANVNLQMPLTPALQSQTWHRINTSLIGDTIQIGFNMSDSQMRDPTLTNQFSEIELHAFILDVSPSQVLA